MAEEIVWDNLSVGDDFFFDFDVPVLSGSPAAEELMNSSDLVSSWVDQIESVLMNDDDMDPLEPDKLPNSDFLAEIFVDPPANGSGSGDLVALNEPDVVIVDCPSDDSGSGDLVAVNELDVIIDDNPAGDSGSGEVVAGRESDASDDAGNDSSEKENSDGFLGKKSDDSNDSGDRNPEKEGLDRAEVKDDVEDDDPVAKKRRRQLRNRDAAVRSRERKKIYLKDLETKSKYLERECMRLGRLLQCFVAENQALRLCLRKGANAYDASTTKQESAVLFWESLLLGSLLVYLGGIICRYPQAPLPPATTVENNDHPENVAGRGQGNSMTSNTSPAGKCRVTSRRFKASRPRMKLLELTAVLIPAQEPLFFFLLPVI